jgi:acyl dehydratase
MSTDASSVPAASERPPLGKITEEMIADMRSRIGRKRPAHRAWNTGASFDSIHHFAEGIGDMNPLWIDRAYGAGSVWGRQMAPPTYVYTLGIPLGGGMRGVHGLFGGTAQTWHHPIYEGDELTATTELVDIVKHEGRLSPVMYRQVERMEYTNQDGVLVCEAEQWAIRFERDVASERRSSEKGRYSSRALASYTPDAIKGIDEEYAREERRGAKPLYWEDVEVGDYVPHVVKGPLRVTDIICYMMGGGGPYARAHAVNWAFRQEHPAAYVIDERGVPECVEAVHWDDTRAQKVGTPAAYDYGPERPSWIVQALCNWMGDHGWVEYHRFELRGVNVVGDVTRCAARVTRKYVEEGRHLLDLDTWAQNQMGEVTARGQGRVRLPAREGNDPGAAPELAYGNRAR